jgi:GNAT superfamily N-acetyltransferase
MSMDDIVVIHALEAIGFRTMDVLVTWIFDFSGAPMPDLCLEDGFQVRGYQPGDEVALTRLASLANSRHMPNRFRADPHFQVEACDELYRQWMLNSISMELADYISVIEFEGRVVAYSSLKYQGDMDGLCNVRLSQPLLGAVVPEMRNRGLGSQALIHNLKWLEDKTDIVHVGTQANNIAAQSVWANLGFRPARSGPSMHLWLDR